GGRTRGARRGAGAWGNIGGDGRYPGIRITRKAERGTRNIRVSQVPRGTSISGSAFRLPRSALRPRPMALLELLAAAAGTRIVAAHARVGIAGEGRLGRRGPRRARGLVRGDQAIGRRLGRHDGRGAASPASRLPARR